MQDLASIWQATLEKLELTISHISFLMWFKPLKVVDFVDNKLVIATNSTSAKNQILRNYIDKLSSACNEVFGREIEIEILDPSEEIEYVKNNAETEKEKEIEVVKNPFNPKYTFDNFVVGKSNNFVYAAARNVAEHPGEKFNPLFIYGGVGLGKTHILHAIGNYLKEFNPNLNVLYVTCEQFTNDYIESLGSASKNKAISEFRTKYRNLDVLMVDDIQFISKKTSTQEEFFHTFNELYQNNKQIIITSDRPPKEIENLADRITSRLTAGLIQDIQSPDLETRIAILRKKCQIEKYVIDDDVIDYIAERVNSNIRELEGMLSKVYFLASLLNKHSATMDEAIEAFEGLHEEDKNEGTTPDDIIKAVCEYFNVTKQDLIGKKKSRDVVEPRMISIYLISEILEMPLVSIGKMFGGRDHTTIMHARDKIIYEMKNSNKMKSIVGEIKKMLKSE
jgi:chromosomal replication initiator protein